VAVISVLAPVPVPVLVLLVMTDVMNAVKAGIIESTVRV
jgi:hypothetical protein